MPDSDDTYSCGMVVWLTAGNAVKQFDLVMMMADGKVDMANATGIPIGFAVEESNDGWPAAEDESIGVCLLGSGGVIRNDAITYRWRGIPAINASSIARLCLTLIISQVPDDGRASNGGGGVT